MTPGNCSGSYSAPLRATATECRSSSSPRLVEATTFSIRIRVTDAYIAFKYLFKDLHPPPPPLAADDGQFLDGFRTGRIRPTLGSGARRSARALGGVTARGDLEDATVYRRRAVPLTGASEDPSVPSGRSHGEPRHDGSPLCETSRRPTGPSAGGAQSIHDGGEGGVSGARAEAAFDPDRSTTVLRVLRTGR